MNFLYDIISPFATNIGQVYLQFHTFIDPVLAFLLFFSICSAVFKRLKQFEGKEGKGIAIALGLILTFGFVVLQLRTGFMLGGEQMGIISVIIFLSVVGVLLFDLFKSFFGDEHKLCAFAFTYFLVHSMFLTAFSSAYMSIMNVAPIVNSILGIIYVLAIIQLLFGCLPHMLKFGSSGSKDTIPTPEPRKPETPPATPATPPTTPTPPPSTPPPPSGPPPRPPGQIPTPTPRRRNPTDPPTDPKVVPPGIKPGPEPEPDAPYEPVKPPIPEEQEVLIDLSPQFNPIRSQDGLGACTAFATAAAFEYVLSEFHGMPKRYLSPLYLYYRSRELDGDTESDLGSHNTTAVTVLQKNGECFEELWAFEHKGTGKWRVPPPANADSDAATKKLVQMLRVDKNDTDQFVYALASKNPLLISVEWPADIHGTTASFYHNLSPVSSGGHAVVIVGYHSHYPAFIDGKPVGVKAFKIRNSHDVTFGENGYIWMSAETLKKILRRDPIILKGHTASSTGGKFTIVGRVVADIKINPEMTGAQIFDSNKFPSLIPDPEDPYYVGALAQINGELHSLCEVKVNDPSGKFALEFSANPAEFQKLTILSKAYSKEFGKIKFSEAPEGIVVYKRHEHDKNHEKIYFHIVDFKYSFGGRGGEGYHDIRNPISNVEDKNKNYSGNPITFGPQHTKEVNVIIPIWGYEAQR